MSGEAEFQPEALIRLLGHHGVRYVLIGGLAAVTHGAPLVTQDVDICAARDQGNLDSWPRALREVHAELRGAPQGLAFRLHAPNLASHERLSFTTDVGWIDIMATPAGTTGYDDLSRTAEVFTLFGHRVMVASVEDLIRMKREAGRPKDLRVVEELGALREEIERS